METRSEGEQKLTAGNMVTAMFTSKEDTENVCRALHQQGYSDKEISVIMSEETHTKYFSEGSNLGSKVIKGAVKGTAIGGIAGAIAGAISAIGTTFTLPGLGIVVAGPLAIGIGGALAGGATGGLTGSMIGAGFAEERAMFYEPHIKSGNIVVAVHPRSASDVDIIERVFRDNHGTDIHYQGNDKK